MALLTTLAGRSAAVPPVWLMRQAGRYLPEYRATRATAGSFLDLCYDPALAAEVTLQPIRRYGFDAAILFSDILVVPDALQAGVRFVEGEGPRLDPISSAADLGRLRPDRQGEKFARIAETVARLAQDLPAGVALVGFCGAPWTVATYMVAGEGTSDQAPARLFAYRDPAAFARLIDQLVDSSIAYLDLQVKAGADALMIFDTWAGSLPPAEFETWVVAPTRRIVAAMRASHPDIPVIGFPRGAGEKMAAYARAAGIQGIGCDTGMTPAAMAAVQHATGIAVQGNLDPLALVAGGPALERQVRAILAGLAGRPHIFNLGHGIVPQTPPENVARLVSLIRKGAA